MARVPAEELERLKRDISLERLVAGRGIELRKHGADLIGRCPFHDDRTPSLVISPAKNLWHCLGACQTGGSVIDWVMKTEGISFRHAVEILRADFFPLAASPVIVKQSTVPKLGAPISADMDDRELMQRVVEYYHETLKQSPEALGYLKLRGIDSPEMIERFRLGFANRTLGLRLPDKNRKDGAELRTRLAKLGIFREETGHEHFNGSLVIPVFNEEGDVTEMYGRKVTPRLRPGTPLHLYLPGPHRGVWNVEALRKSKEIIVCEALIDALTFWCAGFRNVTSSYGIEGFTPDHLAAFKRYGTQRVLIAYDRDGAGNRAADALSKKLIAEGLAVYRIEFPHGLDANEYALKVQPPAKSLGLAIRSAAWIGGSERREIATQATTIAASSPRGAAKEEIAPADVAHADLDDEETDIFSPAATDDVPLLMLDEPIASPRPPAPRSDLAADVSEEEVIVRFGDRRYRVRGMRKSTSFDSLRLNILVSRDAPIDTFFVDTFDLYSSRQRAMFEKQAAIEIGVKEEVVKKDLGALLRKLEELQEEAIRKALEPQEQRVTMDDAQRRGAMQLLEDPISRLASSPTSPPAESSAKRRTSSWDTSRLSLASSIGRSRSSCNRRRPRASRR